MQVGQYEERRMRGRPLLACLLMFSDCDDDDNNHRDAVGWFPATALRLNMGAFNTISLRIFYRPRSSALPLCVQEWRQ